LTALPWVAQILAESKSESGQIASTYEVHDDRGVTLDTDFWHQKWKENDIAFHQEQPNPVLVKHFQEFCPAAGSRVFVPLCGKTVDIHWLLSSGYRVVGAELSSLAIDQLFAELKIEPNVSSLGQTLHYKAEGIDIFVGNIFELSGDILGPIDAVYDRAALVALPEETRVRYSAHLTKITSCAPQFLICYEYDQNAMAGPPFSISDDEVERLYGAVYRLLCVANGEVSGGLKGQCPANEKVWLLTAA